MVEWRRTVGQMATVEARYKHNLLRDGFSSSSSFKRKIVVLFVLQGGKKNKKIRATQKLRD